MDIGFLQRHRFTTSQLCQPFVNGRQCGFVKLYRSLLLLKDKRLTIIRLEINEVVHNAQYEDPPRSIF